MQSARETKGGAEPAVLTLSADATSALCSTVVARRVKLRALGAMGAAATLPGDRITGIAPSLVVLKNVGEVP